MGCVFCIGGAGGSVWRMDWREGGKEEGRGGGMEEGRPISH